MVGVGCFDLSGGSWVGALGGAGALKEIWNVLYENGSCGFIFIT